MTNVEYIPSKNEFWIDGKRYAPKKTKLKKIDSIPHVDKVIFGEADENQIKDDKKVIIEELSKMTTKEELLDELIKEVTPSQLRIMAKQIIDKKPIKKHKGCLGFKIGRSYLELIP